VVLVFAVKGKNVPLPTTPKLLYAVTPFPIFN